MADELEDAIRVCSHLLALIARDTYASFAALNNGLHDAWARRYGSHNLALLRYTPSDCAETFPMPFESVALCEIGRAYYDQRSAIMSHSDIGMTDVYNLFNDQNDESKGIQKLRQLHVEMDQAVAAAYDWTDLDLGHGFHETKQGLRFTISEPARREVLQRLLKLNHQRYEEEVKQGLHSKKKVKAKKTAAPKKKPAKKSPKKQEATLFDVEEGV